MYVCMYVCEGNLIGTNDAHETENESDNRSNQTDGEVEQHVQDLMTWFRSVRIKMYVCGLYALNVLYACTYLQVLDVWIYVCMYAHETET